MKKNNKFAAMVANAKLTGKVYSPEIKLGFGLGLIFMGFVMTIKATKNPAEEIEEAENELVDLHEQKDEIEFHEGGTGYNRRLIGAYRKLGMGYVKTYALPAMCLAAGTGLIIKSHMDLRESQIYYAGVAGAMSKEINDIYARVEEKYGKEEADRLVKGMEQREIEVVEKDENGKDKLVKKTVNVISPDWNGFYTYRWTPLSNTYKKNRLLRQAYLDSMNQYYNDILALRRETSPKKIGHVFLQEVLKDFDLDLREEGQYVGWLSMDNNVYGDGYVEITEITAYETNAAGILEEVSLLSFNVDGNILPTLFPRAGSK